MRFQIPQFIETETAIIGPLTWKQFIWVGMGMGLLLILVRFLSGFFLIFASMIIIAVSGAFAFLKLEGMNLMEYLLHVLKYTTEPKKYIFKKDE